MRLVFLLFIFVSTSGFGQKTVPELWGQRVHDDAHVLKPETVDMLERRLKAYEDSTSNQIAVLTISSLDGEAVEEYSLRVAEKWKLGQKNKDNGVLLLVAVDDHKMRIEVGQGLEGVLTDAQSNQIIRNDMAPEFRRGDYDAGINAGVDGMVKAIAGEYKADGTDSSGGEFSFGEKVLYGLFIFGILGLFTMIALFTPGCTGWGLYAFLLPFYAVFPWIVIGVSAAKVLFGIYLVATPIVKILVGRTKWGRAQAKKMASSSGRSGGSGWSGGSSWGGGSSWSSGSSGSSSFSGGGGSFGGGGSSGGW